eukprot:3518697-Amphidinium_carterae.1
MCGFVLVSIRALASFSADHLFPTLNLPSIKNKYQAEQEQQPVSNILVTVRTVKQSCAPPCIFATLAYLILLTLQTLSAGLARAHSISRTSTWVVLSSRARSLCP